MVWAHTPSKVQLLIYNRILSVSNFLCCYDPINYSFLGKKRTGMRQKEMTPAEKINTNIFPFPNSFYFTLISRGIRCCKIVRNYMTITVHLPWASRAAIESHESHLVSLIHFVVWILTRWEKPCWMSWLLGIRHSTLNHVANGVKSGNFHWNHSNDSGLC